MVGLPTNLREEVENTLAYYTVELITRVKRFMEEASIGIPTIAAIEN